MQPGFHLVHDMAVDRLAALWQELETRSDGSFFLSWSWVGCWLRQTGAPRDVVVGKLGDSVVLLGVVVPRERRDVLPLGIRGLHLNTTGVHDTDIITIEYNGFLVERGQVGLIETAAIHYLLGNAGRGGRGCDELHMKSVPLAYGEELRHPELVYREMHRKRSYRINLDAVRAGGAGYLPLLSANTRQKLRQSIRLYEQQGELEFRRAADVAEALDYLDRLGELHQETWVSRGEPGAFSYAFFVSFHRALIAECLPQGKVEIVRVSCGAQPIGYIYNFLHRGQVLFYLSGFRYSSDARLKPGMVTHLMCIDAHLREGAIIYDFMEGEARYKASLGSKGPDSVYLLVQRRTWPIRLENGLRQVKRLAGRLWPTAWERPHG